MTNFKLHLWFRKYSISQQDLLVWEAVRQNMISYTVKSYYILYIGSNSAGPTLALLYVKSYFHINDNMHLTIDIYRK